MSDNVLVCVYVSEWYPVYGYEVRPECQSYNKAREVSQEMLDRWKDAEDRFNAMQDEMAALYEGEAQK